MICTLKREVVYQVLCKDCKKACIGETISLVGTWYTIPFSGVYIYIMQNTSFFSFTSLLFSSFFPFFLFRFTFFLISFSFYFPPFPLFSFFVLFSSFLLKRNYGKR